ncbi:hypothetical protein [Occultella gossypii]|uniref:Uncharacterized protein n=1 Tax=Occultella gossypii TaxID=2800820 RepID=A0ABS7SBX1_9MICO|nr:hypothetical protein [Occultella gossypii]MBZ2197245.1 hypothetical protein [Occultella gossypii]
MSTYATHAEARAAGQHSRRHVTRQAQDEAREDYKAYVGPAARRSRVEYMRRYRALNPEERLLLAIFGGSIEAMDKAAVR